MRVSTHFGIKIAAQRHSRFCRDEIPAGHKVIATRIVDSDITGSICWSGGTICERTDRNAGVTRNGIRRTAMAEKPHANDDAGDKPPKSKSSIVACLVSSLVGGGVGYATPKFLPHAPETVIAAPEESLEMREPIYLSFGEVIVNLDEGRLNRYLRMKLTLQVERRHEESIRTLLETHSAILKNWLIGHLSDKDTAEIRGAAGLNMLRREIQDQFNVVLCPDGHDRVRDVLFEEFNIQ
jgi:flagellar protein FliL